MTPPLPCRRLSLREGAGALLRVVIGVLLVYLGLGKAWDPVQFLKLVREYELVTAPAPLSALAGLLPWLEVFLGLMLVCGIAVRGTALVTLALLLPFTAAVLARALTLQASLGIPFCAVRFDCGCGLGEVWICAKLAENTLLTAAAVALVAGAGSRWCARYRLRAGSPASR